MAVFGWDASDFDWQRGTMDVDAAKRDGITFFTHKATEGTSVKHWKYGEAMRRAVAAGMEFRGAYMVVRTPGNNGHGFVQAQVDYYFAYLDQQTPGWHADPGFFHQVDTEHWGYDDVAPQYGVEACDLLRAQTGQWVVHYAPRWSYGESIGGDHPLWASSYGTNPAVPYRQAYPGDGASGWTPYSGRTPTFLQYGSRLTIGSQPTCDADAFRGTIDDLRTLITGTPKGWLDMALTEAQQADLYRRVCNIDNAWYYDSLNLDQIDFGMTDGTTGKATNIHKKRHADVLAALAKVQVAAPTDAQIAAQADRIAAALIASNANGLTPTDHDGVVADVKRALREGTK